MPMLPKRGCAEHGCRNVAECGSARCAMHQRALQRRYDDRRGTTVERGYDADHEHLRVLCFVRDEWRCRGCGWEPPIVEQFRLAGLGELPVDAVLDELRRAKLAGERHLHADHVLSIATHPGLRLELENLQTLCDWCHRRKTMKEMASGGVVQPSPPRLAGEQSRETESGAPPRAR